MTSTNRPAARAAAKSGKRHPVIDEAEAKRLAKLLERDDVELGRKITDAEWARRQPRGRPSLSAPGTHSPKVSVRLPADVHKKGVERAEREGKSLSTVMREAIETYLAT